MNAITPDIFGKGSADDEGADRKAMGTERDLDQTVGRSARSEAPLLKGGETEAPTAPSVSAGAGAAGPLGIRVLRILVGLAVYFVLEIVVKVVTVLQLIYVAWKKRPNPAMQRLGAMIGDYTNALWRYGTFASQEAPWPFNPWPRDPSDGRAP